MRELWPVMIASKGRPNAPAFSMLNEGLVPFVCVVEPQDFDVYELAGLAKRLVVLPENDKGLAYARNFCKDYAVDADWDWVWFIDDDVKRFCATDYTAHKSVPCEPDVALLGTQEQLELSSAAMGGMEYRQFAWSATSKVRFPGYADCVVALDLTAIPVALRYNEHLMLKVDRDFTLRVLTMGMRSVKIPAFSFDVPPNGSNKGGLRSVYMSGQEKAASAKMAMIWGPDLCRVIQKKTGRWDVKINWRKAAGK